MFPGVSGRSTRWRRSSGPGCRRCGSLITAQETVTTHWPASRPQGLSTPALISSPSISLESLNDRREAGAVLGRSGSQEVGREQLERKRVLAAVGSLPFCPLPAPQPLCASFGRMLRDALGLPSPCALRRGDASLQTQVGKLLGRWGQGWTGPGEAHGVRIRPTLLSISPTSCSHLALTGPAGVGAHCENTLLGVGIGRRV